jgi:prepilin-type processing-associated H-X9-DG protein
MDENLIGYLLRSLDADEQREVERYLRDHPEAQKRLEQLRRRLDVLAQDADEGEPPAGLWVKALARVAEHKCRVALPSAPPATARSSAGGRPSWWRRADLLVAAVLLVLVGGLGAVWLANVHRDQHVIECANNLHRFDEALEAYADTHNGQFPWVGAEPPKNFAGSFVPALSEARAIRTGLSVNCPGDPPRPPADLTFAQLGQMSKDEPDKFKAATRDLAGCYAYSLGYRDFDGTGLYGLTKSMDGHLPLMADAPSCDGGNEVRPGNSTNHGGRGQNVLFIDGHVEFRTTRSFGADDDIYLNIEHKVAAGRGPQDTVLGRSDAVPLPAE